MTSCRTISLLWLSTFSCWIMLVQAHLGANTKGKYTISQSSISPAAGISSSKNYKVFANTAPLLGSIPDLPKGISSITGLLNVFPDTSAPPIDFRNNNDLFIHENQPIGQIVGQFSSASKFAPDSYMLVPGKGDTDNAHFSIDSDGTLRSGVIFDYENSTPELSIRVQANRGNKSKIEKVFTIQLIDKFEDLDADGIADHKDPDLDGDGYSNKDEIANGTDPDDLQSTIGRPIINDKDSFRPVVRTLSDYTLLDGNLTVHGEVADPGNSNEDVTCGFIVANNPDAKIGDKNQLNAKSKGKLGSFSHTFPVVQLKRKKIYVRAFARNSEGISYGASITIHLKNPLPTLAWADASRRPDADNWWESPWLGAIYAPQENGWILLQDLHWVFILPQPQGKGIWLWKEGIGWLWTRKSTFPYLFSHTSQSWVFLHGSSQDGALLFDHQNENWLVLKKD